MYGSKKQTQEIRALRKVGGKWLKEQREAVGLSQRDLASGLDCHTPPSSRTAD